MQLSSFVPRALLGRERAVPWAEWSEGAVLFADVSGFTPLSEALARLGPEGGEVLTDLLNRYFGAMIEIVSAYGGDVMKFGGDAILCFFADDNAMQRSAAAALRMQDKMTSFASLRTPAGRHTLRMKIGLARGSCLLAGVGQSSIRTELIFAGPPVDATSDAEHAAKQGDIVVADREPPTGLELEPIEAGLHRLLGPSTGVAPVPLDGRRVAVGADVIRPYVVREIADVVAAGAHEHAGVLAEMVPMFLRFEGLGWSRERFDLGATQAFVDLLVDELDRFGGRVSHFSNGDKGSTALVLFGAPNPLERKEELACTFGIEVLRRVRAEHPAITVSGGMTCGRVFGGIVGGADRFSYTVMGDVVNLAARLMQASQAGDLLATAALAERASGRFDLVSVGMRRFKGKSEEQEVFVLRDRRRSTRMVRSEAIGVGRERESAEIMAALTATAAGRPSVIAIGGEAGIGKTELIDRAIERTRGEDWQLCRVEGDLTLRHVPYAPWSRAFPSLLGETDDARLARARAIIGAADAASLAHLPLAADVLGLPTGDTVAIDDEARGGVLHHVLTSILLGAVGPRPLLIVVDNFQWLDTLSIELLLALLAALREQRIAVLIGGRSESLPGRLADRPICRFLTLPPIDAGEIRQLAARTLNGEIADELVTFVEQRSGGRPFFVRELLRQLMAGGDLMMVAGQWSIGREAMRRPLGSGEEILLTALDRLPAEARWLLRWAAVAGATFPAAVLEEACGGQNTFRGRLAILERERVLIRRDREHLAFAHQLTRDAVYQSLPVRFRRRVHRRIGLAWEKAGDDGSLLRLTALADHFDNGAETARAAVYAELAGRRLIHALSYPEAAAQMAIAERGHRRGEARGRWLPVAAAYAECLLRAGRSADSQRLAERVALRARREGNWPVSGEAIATAFDARQRMGDDRFVDAATRWLKLPLPAEAKARIESLVGLGLLRRGRRQEAETWLLRLAETGERTDPTTLAASVLLVSTARLGGQIELALQRAEVAVERARAAGNAYQEIRASIEKGNALREAGNPAEAQRIFGTVSPQVERMGDRHLLGEVQVNWALSAADAGDLATASKTLEEAIRAFGAIGARTNRARAVLKLGFCAHLSGALDAADTHYREAIEALAALGSRSDVVEGCYNLAELHTDSGHRELAEQWIARGRTNAKGMDDYLTLFDALAARLTPPNQPSPS